MTKDFISFMDVAALDDDCADSMKFDLFDGAIWRRKVSEPSKIGTVTVTLSTGKTVTVNSKLLGLLRVLADELAKTETRLH